MYGYRQLIKDKVALRKESVDRNTQPGPPRHTGDESLSARRAWIEMLYNAGFLLEFLVALRKESVDRNVVGADAARHSVGRSPQGERG